MLKQYRDKDCMQGIGMPAGSEFRKYPMDQEEMKALIKEKRSRLVSQQMLIKEHRFLFWWTAGAPPAKGR